MTNHNFKTRLARNDIVLAPGVYDALSALVAEQAGFEALYLSGASIAYTRLGRSDIGLTTFTEVADTLARITERVSLPVIVDADTGFGNALNTQRTVRGFERAGAAMVQIEDQTFPKRCGHLDGKAVVPEREMVGKLKAALDARASRDTLILARTDAVAVEGLDAALDRAEAYLECGVDALFIEALRSPEQMDAACQRFARPRAAAGQHGRRRQDAGAGRGRAAEARLSHRDLSGRHGARGGAHAAGLLREPAPAPHHAAVARADAGLRCAQRGDRHARADAHRARSTTEFKTRIRTQPQRSTRTSSSYTSRTRAGTGARCER
jgi:2-methylisocitrate lyase-like PEP mutase family enzyme